MSLIYMCTLAFISFLAKYQIVTCVSSTSHKLESERYLRMLSDPVLRTRKQNLCMPLFLYLYSRGTTLDEITNMSLNSIHIFYKHYRRNVVLFFIHVSCRTSLSRPSSLFILCQSQLIRSFLFSHH
jgi:hypothetical protein